MVHLLTIAVVLGAGGTIATVEATDESDALLLYDRHTQDEAVRELAKDAITLHRQHGEDAWDIITPRWPVNTNDLYVFVLDDTTLQTVANGAFPDRLGHVPYSILNTGDRPIEFILDDLVRDGETWTEYVFTNPGTGTPQYKRTYLEVSDGFIFGSGYYLPDARIQAVIDATIQKFNKGGTESFESILGLDLQVARDAPFVAIVNSADASLVAIREDDTWLNNLRGLPIESDNTMIDVLRDVHREGHAWVERVTNNTAVGIEQVMRQLWQLEGDYVYISGYYMPDSEVQSAVDEALQTYRLWGVAGFDVLTPDRPTGARDGYAFVLDGNRVVAHGADPAMLNGTINIASQDVGWVEHNGTKRTWLYEYDGYLFGSTYDIRDVQAEAIVRNMVHLYNAHAANHTVALVNSLSDGIAEPDPTYPFILDLEGRYLAHGADRTSVGQMFTGNDLPKGEGGGIWVEHSEVNPTTGMVQIKTTWLYLHDGLVFGSGYQSDKGVGVHGAYAQLTGTVTIGLMAPLTGGLGNVGEEGLAGANLALQDFNEHLREAGAEWLLNLTIQDTASNTDMAQNGIRKLYEQGVTIVAGPLTSANTQAVKQYADAHRMVVLSCCSSAPALAIPGDSVYRLAPSDSGQAVTITHLLAERGIKALVPIWRADSYGDGLLEVLQDEYEAAGGIVYAGIRYPPQTPEMSLEVELLDKYVREAILLHGPDRVAVMMISFGEAAKIAAEASRYDVLDDVMWFASESATLYPQLTGDRTASAFAEKVHMTAAEVLVEHGQYYDRVTDTVLSQIGYSPSVVSPLYYDAVWLVGLAILESNTTDALVIREALPKVAAGFDGGFAHAGLDQTGDAILTGHRIVTVMGEEWVAVDTHIVDPDSSYKNGE